MSTAQGLLSLALSAMLMLAIFLLARPRGDEALALAWTAAGLAVLSGAVLALEFVRLWLRR